MKKEKKVLIKLRLLLHLLQHLSIGCAVALLAIVILGTFVSVETREGKETYHFSLQERNQTFEESELFQELLGKNMTDLICYGAIRSQMETSGVFDGNKEIDITAFANRYYGVSGEYQTAYYSLSDLLKWAQSGYTTTLKERTGTKEKEELKDNLYKTAGDLLINYQEYLSYKEYYDQGDSSMVYFIQRKEGTESVIYSNVKNSKTQMNLSALKEAYPGTYLYYDSEKMVYETDSKIEEGTVRYVLDGYSYAYPEATRIYIAVQKPYQMDVFGQAALAYENLTSDWGSYLVLAGILFLLAIFIVVLLTRIEGVAFDEKSQKTLPASQWEDRIPTEILLILLGIFLVIFWQSSQMLLESAGALLREMGKELLSILLAGYAVLCSMAFSFFYYSIVRRIRLHSLLHNSLMKRVSELVIRGIRYLYQHASLVVRSFVPGALLILVNLLIPLLILGSRMSRKSLIAALLIAVFDLLVLVVYYKAAAERDRILSIMHEINTGNMNAKAKTSGLYGENQEFAREVNGIGESISHAIATSMKDERMKADLITNVSHDIKTPLTSIINYVDLIKREQVENEKVQEYIQVLDAKSQRLKQLIDDLVEASKISSGNIVLQLEKINLTELLHQSIGEFSDKFDQKQLTPVVRGTEGALYIQADSRRIFRVIENLFNNIYKYAMTGTRVYMDLERQEKENQKPLIVLSIKNISESPITIDSEELTERFIRGDESRTTEGSGLGLSIAKSLISAMNGEFSIQVDGDLFKVVLTFQEMQ